MKIIKEEQDKLFVEAFNHFIKNRTKKEFAGFLNVLYENILKFSGRYKTDVNRSMGRSESFIDMQIKTCLGIYKNQGNMNTHFNNLEIIADHFKEVTVKGFDYLSYLSFGEYRNLDVPEVLKEEVKIILNEENIKKRKGKKTKSNDKSDKRNILEKSDEIYRFFNKGNSLSVKVEGIPIELLILFNKLVEALELNVEIQLVEKAFDFNSFINDEK